MNTPSDMAAFGASEAACCKWPADTEYDRGCRAAFCEGAGWSADEIERLRALEPSLGAWLDMQSGSNANELYRVAMRHFGRTAVIPD